MPDNRHIAVIGLGTFGAAIARELSRMGDTVTGIDIDPDIVAAMDGQIDVVVQANATDAKVLDHAGIDSYDAVIIAIGDD
ncbi:MAG: NAD-binding protein, partial [Pseudomonadota bacterium]